MVLAATLRWDGHNVPVRIANLSPNGALVFADRVPPQDKDITLISSNFEIRGWIAWAGASHAGINFDDPIDVSDLMPKARRGPGMVVKDERGRDFRRPGFRGNQLTAEERRVLEEWKRR